jgi:hypothetical protein
MNKNNSQIPYIIIVFAAILLIGYELYTAKLDMKDLGTGLIALLGTVVGATLAFKLNEDREHEREHAAHRIALNRVLFTIARQRNAIRFLSQEIEPYKTSFDRAFNFPATVPPPYKDLIFQFETLDFLLESDNTNCLYRLSVEQERFHQVIESLNIRNEFYVRELQPEMARLKLNNKSIKLDEIQSLLGERLYGTAINSAEIYNSHIATSMESLCNMQKEIWDVAKKQYPKHQFIKYIEKI